MPLSTRYISVESNDWIRIAPPGLSYFAAHAVKTYPVHLYVGVFPPGPEVEGVVLLPGHLASVVWTNMGDSGIWARAPHFEAALTIVGDFPIIADAPDYIYNLTYESVAKVRSAFKRTSRPLRVLLTGDSKINGQVLNGGNEQQTRNPAHRTAAKLTATGLKSGANTMTGDHAGNGVSPSVDAAIAADLRLTKIGSPLLGPIQTVGGASFRMDTSSDKLRFAPIGEVDQAIILSPSNAGHQKMAYAIDNGTLVEVPSNGSPTAFLQTPVPGFARGLHTFDLTKAASAGAGGAYPIGVLAWASDDKAMMINGAISGMQSSGLLSETAGQPYTRRPAMIDLASDLVITNLCLTNDAIKDGAAISPSVSKENGRTHIRDLETAGADVVIVIESYFSPSVTTGNAARWEEYRQVCFELGEEEGCVVVDIGAKFGSYADALEAGLMSDSLHESFAGYDAKADPLAAIIRYAATGQYSENFA